jgi:hypothetical protein
MKAKKSLQVRKLLEDLHYWQAQVRIEARWLKQSRAKCKAIEKQLCQLMRKNANPN